MIRWGVTPDKLYGQCQIFGEETTEKELNFFSADANYYFTIDAYNGSGFTKGTRIVEAVR